MTNKPKHPHPLTTYNGFNFWCAQCEEHYYHNELDPLFKKEKIVELQTELFR